MPKINFNCQHCGKPSVKYLHAKNQESRHYCSKHCYHDGKHADKWDSEALSYVQQHILSDGHVACAAHFGTSVNTFLSQCSRWRSQGYKVPKVRNKEVGDIRTIQQKGREYTKVKTENGWQYVRKERQDKPKRVAPPKREIGEKWRITMRGVEYEYTKAASGKSTRVRITPHTHIARMRNRDKVARGVTVSAPKRFKAAKPEKPAFITRSTVFNPETHKRVRVNSKTQIEVLKTIPDEVAIENWHKKYGTKAA